MAEKEGKKGGMDPLSILAGVTDAFETLGIGGSDGLDLDDQLALNKRHENQKNAEILIELITKEVERQDKNRRVDAMLPFIRDRLTSVLDPTSGPFNPIMARSRPRTYAAGGAAPGADPGVSMTPGGEAVSQAELEQLIPDFAKFQGIREQARAQTAGFAPENFKQGSVMEQLPGYSLIKERFFPDRAGAAPGSDVAAMQATVGGGTPPVSGAPPPPAPSGTPPASPGAVPGQDPALTEARRRAEERARRLMAGQVSMREGGVSR